MVQEKGFNIIGLEIRTNNSEGRGPQEIGALWSRYTLENLLDKIPNALDKDLVSLYTDYASDFTGDYTYVLGLQVSSLDEIPEGMIGRTFPPANFEIFQAHGELPTSVYLTWQEIWKKDAELNRAYLYDFEKFDDRARQGEQAIVDIFISVK